MYDRYRSRSRDRYRRSSPEGRDDREYYRSRKERSRSPLLISRASMGHGAGRTMAPAAKEAFQLGSVPDTGPAEYMPPHGSARYMDVDNPDRAHQQLIAGTHAPGADAGRRVRGWVSGPKISGPRERDVGDDHGPVVDRYAGRAAATRVPNRRSPGAASGLLGETSVQYLADGIRSEDSESHRNSLSADKASPRAMPPSAGPSAAAMGSRTSGSSGGSSSTLILEGLPDDVTEKDIIYGLEIVAEWPNFESDMIRAVRLRNNKRGYRIAFVEFYRERDAVDFLEHHSSSINLPLTHSRGIHAEPVAVSMNYSRDREENEKVDTKKDDNEWSCLECGGVNYPQRNFCYRCKVERPDDSGYRGGRGRGNAAATRGPLLTGETDACPQQFPSQYLVVRGLEPTVTEDALARGVMKLFVDDAAPGKDASGAGPAKLKSTAPIGNTAGLGAKPRSLRRVFLMRDRLTNETWRYGFAEFSTLEDAQAAMAKFRASSKFTVASKPVVVAFIHTGVFVPLREHANSDAARFAFSPVYNQDIFLKYWDDRVYPSIHDVFIAPESRPSSREKSASPDRDDTQPTTGAQDAHGKKPKKVKEKALAMAPQMQMWQKKRAELHGKSSTQGRNGSDDRANLGPTEKTLGLRAPHWRDSYMSFADWDSLHCVLCEETFKTAQDLRDHETLGDSHLKNLGDDRKKENAKLRLEEFGKQPELVHRRRPRDRSAPAPRYISYADADKIHCLVCQRKFKNVLTLRLHERESEMHRKNMANENLVDRAIAELSKMDKQPAKMRPADMGDKGQYRDRAKERRVAFNQPRKPGQPPAKRRKEDEKPAPAETIPKAAAPSKGASLLNKMGWTAGQGLGAEGSGRTEAIRTDLYAPGVGLGAEGGKVGDAADEAAQNTQGGYSNFVEKIKDKARARFEKLS